MQYGKSFAAAGAPSIAQIAPNAIRASTALRMFPPIASTSLAGIVARRRGWPALAVDARLAAAAIERIGDAIRKPPRRGRLALLVAGEGAVAQARRIIALQAKRIAGPDRLRRSHAGDRQPPGSGESQKHVAHGVPPADRVVFSIPRVATQAGPQGSRQLTFVR